MKTLVHPALKDITVEGILNALADPVRLQIFIEIERAQCPQICAQFLKLDNLRLPKSTLSKHFRILREAGLIRSVRKGVEMHNTTRCDEIKGLYGVLIRAIIETYGAQAGKPKPRKRRA